MVSVVSFEDCVFGHRIFSIGVTVKHRVAVLFMLVGASVLALLLEDVGVFSVAEYQPKQEDTSTQVLWALLLSGKKIFLVPTCWAVSSESNSKHTNRMHTKVSVNRGFVCFASCK